MSIKPAKRTFSERITEIWQDRSTGKVFSTDVPPEHVRDESWHRCVRRVRLYHHPESDCVFIEDYDADQSVHHENQAVEVTLDIYNYWNTIYKNDDL